MKNTGRQELDRTIQEYNSDNIKFEDLFDLEELQIIQDSFAKTTGVASIITSPDGKPITKPSNFCRLCNDIIRKTEKGLANCIKSDMTLGSYNPHGPKIQKCMSGGLFDAGASITVGGKHVANWLIGQVKNDSLNEEEMLKYAREIHANEDDFKAALGEVNEMSIEKFKEVSETLFLLANELSSSAFKNVKLSRILDERNRVEEKRRESEEQFKSLVSNIPGTVYRCELEAPWRMLYLSDEIENLTGYRTSDLLENGTITFGDIIHPDDTEMIDKVVAKAIEKHEAYTLEYRIIDSDGEIVWIYERGRGYYVDGKALWLDGIFIDISEQKQLEEQYRQSQKMEVVGRLAGGIAHDFNNLLTAIIGSAELAMIAMNKSDPLFEDINGISEAANIAAELTSQLLAFSRKQIIDPKVINLNCVIIDMTKLLLRTIGEDINLNTVPGKNLWNVKADVGQLEQIILNLAVNSRDAMNYGGELTIETANISVDKNYIRSHAEVEKGRYVQLSVSDSGIGMDDKIKDKIFEPFFTTKAEGKGTGLGLATVYGSVKQNNGHLWVYSEKGVGTTFKIYLPMVESGEDHKDEKQTNIDDLRGNEFVLVVEDNHIVRESAVRSLKRFGYNVDSTSSGADAIQWLEKSDVTPDLILSDVVMPNMNGAELSRKLKEKNYDIPILFMSGYTENAIVHQGVLDPNTPYIQKPLKPLDLVEKVRRMMNINNHI